MRPALGKIQVRKVLALLFQLTLLVGVAAPASALEARDGGLAVPDPPRISDVICLTDCRALRTASVGSVIQVSGRDMGQVQKISFKVPGGRVRVDSEQGTETSVKATVPQNAQSGPVRVVATGGTVSASAPEQLTIGPRPDGGNGSLELRDLSTTPRRAYLFGATKPSISFVLGGTTSPTDLRVDVVDAESAVVFSTFMRGVSPNQSVRFRWSGRDSSGRTASAGRYTFRISDLDGQPLPRTAPGDDGLAFRLFGFVFPVRGPHSFGDGIGAGRGHQGADVLADCGRPLVAARGGRVYWNDYQAGGAGHYIVINLAGTRNQSHVYMHLTAPSPHREGTFVGTGERIGTVGTTGRSTGCHLHFEHWSSPGWYQGGTFLDPMERLRRWDRYS